MAMNNGPPEYRRIQRHIYDRDQWVAIWLLAGSQLVGLGLLILAVYLAWVSL